MTALGVKKSAADKTETVLFFYSFIVIFIKKIRKNEKIFFLVKSMPDTTGSIGILAFL